LVRSRSASFRERWLPLAVAIVVFAVSLALSHFYPYTDVKADAHRYVPDCNHFAPIWIDRDYLRKFCESEVGVPMPFTEFHPALPAGGTWIVFLVAALTRSSKTATWIPSAIFSAAGAVLAYRGYRYRKQGYVIGTLGLATMSGYSSDALGALLLTSRSPEIASLSVVFSYLSAPFLVLRIVAEARAWNVPRYAVGPLALLALAMSAPTTPYSDVFRYWCHFCEFCPYEPITFKIPFVPLATLFASIVFAGIVAFALHPKAGRWLYLAVPFVGASCPPQTEPLAFYAALSLPGRGVKRWMWIVSAVADAMNAGIVFLLFKYPNPFALRTPTYAMGFARDAIYVGIAIKGARESQKHGSG